MTVAANCYLRLAGSITGPYARGEIEQMLAREMLSFAHEISSDGEKWLPVKRGLELLRKTPDEEAGEDKGDSAAMADLIAPSSPFPEAWTGSLAGAGRRRGVLSRVDSVQVTTLSCGLLVLFTATLPVGKQWGAPEFAWGRGAGGAVCYGALWLVVIAAALTPWIVAHRRGDTVCAISAFGILLSLGLSVANVVNGDGDRFAALEAMKLLALIGAWSATIAVAFGELSARRRPVSPLAPLPGRGSQEVTA